jgi:hypothetical protein
MPQAKGTVALDEEDKCATRSADETLPYHAAKRKRLSCLFTNLMYFSVKEGDLFKKSG